MSQQFSNLGQTNSVFRPDRRPSPPRPRPGPRPPPFPFPPRQRPPVVIIRDRALPRGPLVYTSPVYYYYPYSSYDTPTSNINLCPPQKPTVCTAEYAPVCGTSVDGTTKTFSNSCNACAHPATQYYKSGSCTSYY
jgi:hypothetical protein